MTKKELIEALASYPDDILIVIEGREGGAWEVESVTETRLRLNANLGYGDCGLGIHEIVSHRETNSGPALILE